MKMLTGYMEPSSGEVFIDGVNVQADPIAAQAQIGYLPESLPLYPEMTVAEYLAYSAELRGLEPHQAVPWAIGETQLEEKATDTIDTLSRGFKQRVGVAQAILHRPKFLILDEPSNGLDPNQIQHMRDLIKRLAKNATVVLSTHIMQEVSAVCSRTLMLRSGKLVLDETLDDLQKASDVVLRSAATLDAGVLGELDAVKQIDPMQSGQWRIAIQGDLDEGVAQVAKLVSQQGLPIYELSPQVRDLESIFRQVNDSISTQRAEVQSAEVQDTEVQDAV